MLDITERKRVSDYIHITQQNETKRKLIRRVKRLFANDAMPRPTHSGCEYFQPSPALLAAVQA